MTTRARLVLIGAGFAFLLLIGWCSRTPPPSVVTIKAHRGSLRVVVATNGTVEPVEDTEVRARLDGRIVAIPDPGKRVEEGAEILRIDDGPVSAELASARSDRLAALESLRTARHALDVVRDRFKADRELFAQQALTRARYDESQAALHDAEERVAALEVQVPLQVSSLDLRIEELEAQKESAVVRARFAGTVYRTVAEKGEMVRVGDPILRIADLDRLRVRANIDQVDLGRVHEGQAVTIMANAFPGRSWSGRVTEVVPNVVVKANRSVSESLAAIEPPTNGLVPGMTVDVEILVAAAADVLQIPTEAIFMQGSDPFVYRLTGHRVDVTPIQIGLTSVTAAEITGGLAEGDVVVLGPVRGLEDGMRVHVRARRDGQTPDARASATGRP
jgi:HlyD family secretion protein